MAQVPSGAAPSGMPPAHLLRAGDKSLKQLSNLRKSTPCRVGIGRVVEEGERAGSKLGIPDQQISTSSTSAEGAPCPADVPNALVPVLTEARPGTLRYALRVFSAL